ncbi:DUF6753 family protein [Nostoc sp. CHAB 5715]|uniref:DUF6753 family protein n=1 Tax=Nostoc sp. CHAB 5715 TaxID=2780400 RepID=UPI001E305CC7|nr:DUF6753 family protein [Nostoc sp. CHAB 5715]MCC5624460.1 hypothetical protein [Nostoc sp. CHAB 5715]
MSATNGKDSDLLDRALRDLSPDQRARALDLVLRLGMTDRDDPLFLICLAIGQLQILMQDAPAEWRGTFDQFSTDLQAWTATNLQALAAIANQAEAAADLAEVSKKLTDTLTVLTQHLNERNKQPQTSTKDSRNLQKKLEGLQKNLSQNLNELMAKISPVLTSVESTSNTLTGLASTSKTITLIKWGMVGLLVLNMGGLYMLWQQQQRTSQQLGWLLQKTTRLECTQGSVAKFNSQCKQFHK